MSTTDLLAQIRAKKQNIADKKTGNKNFYKFKPGTTKMRILPSWRAATEDDRPFYRDFGQAYIKDLDANLLAVIGDRKMTYNENDAVRDLIQLAKAEAPTDAQREHYHQMLAKQQYIVNALILNDSTVDPNTPELVAFTENQLGLVLAQMEKLLLDGEDPFDFAAGYDIDVDRVGTTVKDTRYSYTYARRPSKIDPSVMDRAVDLDAYVRSKFADTDRAINAIKSISQGALLPAPEKSVSYTGGSTVKDSPPWAGDIVDADYTAVDDARDVREPTSTNSVEVSQEEIDKLLGDII